MKNKEQNGKPNEKTPVDWYKIQPVIEVPAKEEKKEEAPVPKPNDVVLLEEIRDLLKEKEEIK